VRHEAGHEQGDRHVAPIANYLHMYTPTRLHAPMTSEAMLKCYSYYKRVLPPEYRSLMIISQIRAAAPQLLSLPRIKQQLRCSIHFQSDRNGSWVRSKKVERLCTCSVM